MTLPDLLARVRDAGAKAVRFTKADAADVLVLVQHHHSLFRAVPPQRKVKPLAITLERNGNIIEWSRS